jgi:hypothetical protein
MIVPSKAWGGKVNENGIPSVLLDGLAAWLSLVVIAHFQSVMVRREVAEADRTRDGEGGSITARPALLSSGVYAGAEPRRVGQAAARPALRQWGCLILVRRRAVVALNGCVDFAH